MQAPDVLPVFARPQDIAVHIGKLGGAVATLALVSVFVFGGVDVAHAAAPVTLTAFNSSGTTSASLAATNTIGGTAEPGVTIAVSMTNSATTAPYCTAVVDPLGYWSCPSGATVPLGSTTFAATDGATTATSAAIMVYGGDSPSLTNPQSGVNVVPVAPVFSGYGPARGSITVLANTGGPICTVASIPDTGTWDCYSTATLVQGSNGFTVMASTPGYPSDTYFSSTSATVPVTVSQLKPPVINYTVGYATVTSAASITFQNGAVGTDLYSITEPSGEGNGYVRSPSTSPRCGPSAGPNALVCAFAALAPGIWEASSYQYVGELAPAYRNDFFRIPAAPSMTATAQPDQTVAFSGTGTTGDLVSVLATGGSDGGTVICNATVAAGAWACAAPATPGNHSYHASQLDQGWTPYLDNDGSGNVAGAPLGSVLGGRSALTQTASVTVLAPPTPPVTPAPPVMNYDFGNASVTITATGDPTGDGSSLDVYALADGDSGYSVTTYPACVSAHGDYLGGTPISTTQTCTLNALTPGIWNISSAQSVNGAQSAFHSDLFRVPDAPTIQARLDSASTVILSGTGTTGDIVTALKDGVSACQATVVSGTWTCTISSDGASHNYTASQLDQGFVPTYSGYSASTVYDARSALSPSVALAAVVPPNSTPPAPPIPTPSSSAQPLPTPTSPTSNIQTLFFWVLSIDGDGGPLHAGDSVTVSSSGLPAGALVSFELHSTPRALGSMTVGADGAFSQTLTIPQDVEPGDHHIVVTVTPPGEVPSPHDAAITVVSAPPTAVSDAASSDAASSDATIPGKIHQRGANGTENRDTPSAPSAFTNALPTFANLMDNPGALVGAVGLALAIMLLVAIPTELLNSTITSNIDRFGSFFARAEGAIERAGEWLTRVTKTRATASAVLIVISSIIFGFADPHYGFDLVSLRLTLSLALAMFIVYYIASFISGRIAKARWGVESEISMQPIALIFAIVGVVLGRVLGFSPGFLIGLALGLELASNAPSAHRAKTLILRTSVIVGLALAAWAGYSLMQLWMAGGTETFWSALAQDTLVSVTAEGLTGMVLALLPLSFMEGKELWDYSKLLWAGLFLFTAAAFSILVLPTAIEGEALGGSLTVWLLVLGCFTAGTLALWAYLRFSRGKRSEGDTSVTANQAKVDA